MGEEEGGLVLDEGGWRIGMSALRGVRIGGSLKKKILAVRSFGNPE